MLHKMKLTAPAFDAIKSGKKIIEIRLYDAKRRIINIEDKIEFTREPDKKEKIKVQVTGLLRYNAFRDLLEDYPLKYFGANNKRDLLKNLYSYYTKEKESQYGVIGIRIKKII